jgi:hypothetical protein
MPKLKCWEKIGDVARTRYQSMWGKKNKKDVVWIDNWARGYFAIVEGKEIKSSTYREDRTYMTVGSKNDAMENLRKYLKEHDRC